jgi:imidazoleglycerol-phosphate dehydratase
VLNFSIDGRGETSIDTGVGFFDHMLTAFCFHGGFDMELSCKGDLSVDCHHTVEDVGIVMGKALSEALGDKKGINRFGMFAIPMDEALASCNVDISNRPYLVFNAAFSGSKIGDLDAQMIKEFFYAFAINAGITLHINLIYGSNDHHMAEAIFKSFGRAIKESAARNDFDGVLSTKGSL